VFACVAQGCSFFGGKEMNQRKPPVKKAFFFPVGASMCDSATALPGRFTPVACVAVVYIMRIKR